MELCDCGYALKVIETQSDQTVGLSIVRATETTPSDSACDKAGQVKDIKKLIIRKMIITKLIKISNGDNVLWVSGEGN